MKPVATTPDAAAASLVWPAGGKCGASRLGGTVRTAVDGFESRQSLDKMVKECVRRAVGPPDRDDGEYDASNASGSLELERFVAFQRSVADALTSAAKTGDEVGFARRFRLVTHESSAALLPVSPTLQPSTDTWDQLRRELPTAVKRLERWLAAAVSIESFRAMVRSERGVFDKRRRLRELQARGSAASPPSDRFPGAFAARIEGDGGKLRMLHDLRRCHANSQHWMADAAQWIAEMRGDNNSSAREDDAAVLTALGQAKPLVEVMLLAALEQTTMPSG